jgi:hypothetical protein
VRAGLFLCFKASLRVVVEFLKLAAPGTPLRTLLAQLVENFPTTDVRKAVLETAANDLWKRYPNCVMDESCAAIARALEIALYKVEDDYRKFVARHRKTRPWRKRDFPVLQAKLLDALDGKDRLAESLVVLEVYGADDVGRVREATLKARLRQLVLDTKKSLVKFKCQYQIDRHISRRDGVESSLSLAPVKAKRR